MSGLDLFALAVFALSMGLFLYHHAVYPLLLRRLAARRRAETAAAPGDAPPPALTPETAPRLVVITPAHNEAPVIEAKIRNLHALAYPRERLTIVLALDGCRDDTEAHARATLRALGDPEWIKLSVATSNVGKVATLNREIAAAADADVVALTDASALLEPDALLRGAAGFVDPRVGVVCGAYRLREAGSGGEAAYWAYQSRIKADEAALAAPMGAHGAFYLFRRALWRPLPDATINDDFVLPMRMVLDGARAVFDEGLIATELERTEARQEFWRRMRIGAGNLQQLLQLWRLGDPRRGALAFLFLSGKGLRVLIPALMIAGALAAIWLALQGYALFQLGVLGGAALGSLAALAIARRDWTPPKPIAVLAYLIEGYAASFLGAVRYVVRGRIKAWSAPARGDAASPTAPRAEPSPAPALAAASSRARHLEGSDD